MRRANREYLVIMVQTSNQPVRPVDFAATFTPLEQPGIPESLRNYKY